MEMEIEKIPIEKIETNPAQVRQKVEENGNIETLAKSIEERGLLHPLVVRQKDDGTYQLISGERRWRAMQKANIEEAPALVKDVNDEEQMVDSLIENIQREDLETIEKGNGAYQVFLLNGVDMEPKEIANILNNVERKINEDIALDAIEREIYNICDKRINKKVRSVRAWLEAISVSQEVQEIEAESEEGVAGVVLSRISTVDEDEQKEIYEKIKQENMNKNEASKFITQVKKLPEEAKESVMKSKVNVDTEDLEEYREVVEKAKEIGDEEMLKELTESDEEIDLESAKIRVESRSENTIKDTEVPDELKGKVEEKTVEVEENVKERKEKEQEVKQDETVQERKKLRENWEALLSLENKSKKVFCPKCYREHNMEDTEIITDCEHEMTMSEARKVAKQLYKEMVE